MTSEFIEGHIRLLLFLACKWFCYLKLSKLFLNANIIRDAHFHDLKGNERPV